MADLVDDRNAIAGSLGTFRNSRTVSGKGHRCDILTIIYVPNMHQSYADILRVIMVRFRVSLRTELIIKFLMWIFSITLSRQCSSHSRVSY